jgi:carbonic anhydrase
MTVAAQPVDHDKIWFNYRIYERPVTMKNDGRVLHFELPNDDGSVGGFAMGRYYPNQITTNYYIYKIVVHTPSEHTFDGAKVPLELQLFHRKEFAKLTNGEPSVGDMAVVAVGFAESKDEASPFLKSLIDGDLPDQRGGTSTVNRNYPSALQFSELFRPVFAAQGETAGFWEYEGSLTQPPCTSGVRWFVRQQPLNAKKETLKQFEDATKKSSRGIPHNARVLQPIGTRPVFPRFAQNAVHAVTFDFKEPDAFKAGFSDAQSSQKKLTEALGGKNGAKAAKAEGLSTKNAVLQNADLQRCLKDYGLTAQDLETAKNLKDTACDNKKDAVKVLDNSVGPNARMTASANVARYTKECQDEEKRQAGLQTQLEVQKKKCDEIKAKKDMCWNFLADRFRVSLA